MRNSLNYFGVYDSSSFMLDGFDFYKEYSGYFPNNNISKVMNVCRNLYNKALLIKIKTRTTKRN